MALRIPGAERCCTGCYQTYTPVSLFRLASKLTTSIITGRVLSFRRFTGQWRRHARWTGLTLSQNKSVVVASHPQLLRAVRRELLEQRLSFEGASSVRDVGLDANAGHRRSVKIQNKREQKCRKKKRPHQGDTERIEVQTLDDEVVQTGSCQPWPVGTLGWACAQVLSSAKERWLQTRVARESRPTIPHFHFGENGDPGIWFPLDQLRTWLELQGEEMGHRLGKIDVARAWAAASACMEKKSRWSMVRCPMTATMATLHDLSIIPVSPWKWYPAENPDVDWTYSGGDPGPFLSEMQQRLSHKVWEQVALHYHGLGAENGVDMTILHKHYKQLVARGAHVRAGMLYKIATAQICDGSRVCEHDPDAQVACALCGSPDDSMFHRVYDCPFIPASFELDRAERIIEEAREKARTCPIFWFRGLPPRGWYPELPAADDPFDEDFGSLHILGGHVFTDGSGGAETKDPRLRRCGCGVTWILSDGGSINTLGG